MAKITEPKAPRKPRAKKEPAVVAEPVVEKSEDQEGKDAIWRLLNRKPLKEAHVAYSVLENKHRQFERSSRLEQAEQVMKDTKKLLKDLKVGALDLKKYEELYAAAWREKTQLEKGEIRSTAWVAMMNTGLLESVGWTLHEYLEHKR